MLYLRPDGLIEITINIIPFKINNSQLTIFWKLVRKRAAKEIWTQTRWKTIRSSIPFSCQWSIIPCSIFSNAQFLKSLEKGDSGISFKQILAHSVRQVYPPSLQSSISCLFLLHLPLENSSFFLVPEPFRNPEGTLCLQEQIFPEQDIPQYENLQKLILGEHSGRPLSLVLVCQLDRMHLKGT